MFPIGDTSIAPRSYRARVTYSIVGINILIFFYQLTLGPVGMQEFVMHYGSIPAELMSGQDLYTIITSMFLHGGWLHLIGNMLFLRVFGDNIEYVLGHTKFLFFYLGGGIAATLAHVLSGPASVIPSVGASGAIAAVMGAYFLMFPESRIDMIMFAPTVRKIQLGAFQFLGYRIATQFLNGVGSVVTVSNTGGVARWAHIGGFVAGVLIGYLYKKKLTQTQS